MGRIRVWSSRRNKTHTHKKEVLLVSGKEVGYNHFGLRWEEREK